MRVVGPNCVGLLSTDPTVRNVTFAALPVRAGGLGLVSRSGALGIAVLDAAARWGHGVSRFVSVGNKGRRQQSTIRRSPGRTTTVPG